MCHEEALVEQINLEAVSQFLTKQPARCMKKVRSPLTFLILLCFFAFTVYADLIKDAAFRISAPYVNVEHENLVLCNGRRER